MRPRTLSEACDRIRRGEPVWKAVAEVLDTFYAASDPEARRAMLRDKPPPTGDARYDALMGGTAEYLTRQHRLGEIPAWTREPKRTLPEPWFTANAASPGLCEFLAFSSPAEFRSRNIFTEARPFRRASERPGDHA